MITRLLTVVLALAPSVRSQDAEIQSPEVFFGFAVGSDRALIDYGQSIAYLEHLAARSPRCELRRIGSSPLGRPMFVAFLSAPENIAALDELGEVNRRLALEPALGDGEREELVRRGRVFLMQTLSMHSTEVGPAQALPVYAHELLTSQDPEILEQLAKVVLMMVPCHNPDGMDMVVEHYRKYMDTPYEGCSLPGIYHRYVGHDNNRDFIALTQTDTQAIARVYTTEWYPQVLVEKHQMGRTGPRYFVPPNHDPIAENIDEDLWTWTGVFGANLSRDMGQAGLKGVASHWVFDMYWPGSTETALWKNVIGMLTECASCKVATPVFVEPTELSVRGKGLAEYAKSINMPAPWPGGKWGLSEIVAYELATMRSVLRTAARHRVEILRSRNELCVKEVAKGTRLAPRYFELPLDQHDRGELVELVDLLQRHGVQVYRRGDEALVVPLAQPYRAFIKEVLEHQRYPERHYSPGGELIRPYDITSWCLPLHRGVEARAVDIAGPDLLETLELLPAGWRLPGYERELPQECWGLLYSANENAAYRAAFMAWKRGIAVARYELGAARGSGRAPTLEGFFLHHDPAKREALEEIRRALPVPPLVLEEKMGRVEEITAPRIALVETWFSDMDTGWTRFLLDSYEVEYTVVRPGDFAQTDFAAQFDVVVFPDAGKDVLLEGKRKSGDRYRPSDYPPEYRKGIGKEGMQRLMQFVEGGGIVVAWRRSSALFLDELSLESGESFQLPARDVSKALAGAGLYVPGAFLRIRLLGDHPLTRGMPTEAGIFSRGTPLFRTSLPILDMDRRVIAWHPDEKGLLLSGYLEGEEQLRNKAALVWLRKGKGQFVLMAFNPQFRASTPATYKLLFNALLLQKGE